MQVRHEQQANLKEDLQEAGSNLHQPIGHEYPEGAEDLDHERRCNGESAIPTLKSETNFLV